jgi:hypothetical protein
VERNEDQSLAETLSTLSRPYREGSLSDDEFQNLKLTMLAATETPHVVHSAVAGPASNAGFTFGSIIFALVGLIVVNHVSRSILPMSFIVWSELALRQLSRVGRKQTCGAPTMAAALIDQSAQLAGHTIRRQSAAYMVRCGKQFSPSLRTFDPAQVTMRTGTQDIGEILSPPLISLNAKRSLIWGLLLRGAPPVDRPAMSKQGLRPMDPEHSVLGGTAIGHWRTTMQTRKLSVALFAVALATCCQ